ncbi:MAG: hypothetical protein V4760_03660 [Bdellovibrionota bacterium]
MKRAVFALIVLALSIHGRTASAGAYGFECTNLSGSVRIYKAHLFIRGEDGKEEVHAPVYTTTIPEFFFAASKAEAVMDPGSVQILPASKKALSDLRRSKTQCGDDMEDETFTQRLTINRLHGGKVIVKADLFICRSHMEGGHCVGEGLLE